jgi:hypothetical protein
MHRKPSQQVQAYLDRALNAKRKAEGTTNPALKAEFLEMEKHWGLLLGAMSSPSV